MNIAGIRQKLEFVCALYAMVSKTDTLDLFWHFSIKHVVFAKATFFLSWLNRQFDWKMSKQIRDISFLTMASRAHTKFNFSRTPPMFKKPLKWNSRWKVSVSQRKKRDLDNRHLMHVIILPYTINIFRPTNAVKPGGRQLWKNSISFLFNWCFHEPQRINAISAGKKKRRNLPNRLCFTAKLSEDYSIQWLRHVMVSRQSSPSMTSCPQ